jgi:hypothetical protein
MTTRPRSLTPIALLAILAGCGTGSPKPGPSPSAWITRSTNASALLAQCAMNTGIPEVVTNERQAQLALPPEQQWLHGDRIELTEQNGSQFNANYEGHVAGIVVGGMSFDHWEIWAGQHDALPPAICGTGVSPVELWDLIYDKYPARLADNPWR